MKAEQARILTNESLQKKYAELENHPEYLAICDKIRASAMAGESSITVEIFSQDVVGLIDKNCFVIEQSNVFSNTQYSIKW